MMNQMSKSLLKYLGLVFILILFSCNSRSDRDSLAGYMPIKNLLMAILFGVMMDQKKD
jgi:hypothetical protein